MKIKVVFFLFVSFLFLQSCQSTKDALQGKTRSERNDEFLVKKKNPLSMPPDFNELPKPLGKQLIKDINDDEDLQKKLKVKKTNKNNNLTNNSSTSLEKKIIEKISD